MTNHTATVEALTAEVRVLMVGSRQVTMSVYGQLDQVDYGQIEPFGRVMPKDAQRGFIYVIGKRIGDGDLGSSFLPSTESGDARWANARSRRASYESSAEDEERCAGTWRQVAAQLEKAAEIILDDKQESYIGFNIDLEIEAGYAAVHHDAQADKHDRAADCYDQKAAAAESEIDRLEAIAAGARERHEAACERQHAQNRRGHAAALKIRAREARAGEDSYRESAGACRALAAECAAQEEREKLAVGKVVGTWAALPLIVLAGLR